MKLKEKDLDSEKISFNHGIDSSLSSSSELYPVGHDLTSSFLPNKFNFKRESSGFRSSRSNLFIFAGLGSNSLGDTKLITGKKRRTSSQASSYSCDSKITENEELPTLPSPKIPICLDELEQYHKTPEKRFQTDDLPGSSSKPFYANSCNYFFNFACLNFLSFRNILDDSMYTFEIVCLPRKMFVKTQRKRIVF